ncbi:unnamed protein product [Gemmata massiliana]|uniref:Polysaccharide biosynthesis protein C-terminal domain-containing protein n=1 Tax=Gemmata massiliana TaxID=1210884 RepID=A0A6P2CXI9_9BACT|nr:unnamed protein product [Gemmata massiliana]
MNLPQIPSGDLGTRPILQAVRGVTVLLLAQVVVVLTGVGTQLACLHSLGLPQYGHFVTINLMALCGSLLLLSGLPQAVRVAIAVEPRAGAKARWYLLVYHLPLTLLAAGVIAATAPVVAAALGDQALVTPIRIAAFDIAARTGGFEPWLMFLNATGRLHVQAFAQIAFAIARFAAVVVAFANGGGLVGALMGFACISSLGLGLAIVGWATWCSVTQAPDYGFAGQVRRALRWTIGCDLFPLLIPFASVWLLNMFGSDLHYIGFFCACVTVSTPFTTFGVVIGAGVYAEAAKSFARGDLSFLRSLVSQAAQVLILLIAVTLALAAVRGGEAARLVSNSSGAGLTLGAVVLGHTCLGGMLFFLDVLVARGSLQLRFRLMLGLACAHIIGTSVLIHTVGPAGAAMAILLSSVGGFAATVWLTRVAIGPFFRPRGIARAVSAASVTAALVASYPRPEGVNLLLAQLASGIGIYVLCLGGMGERFVSRSA